LSSFMKRSMYIIPHIRTFVNIICAFENAKTRRQKTINKGAQPCSAHVEREY